MNQSYRDPELTPKSPQLRREIISSALLSPSTRSDLGFAAGDDAPVPVVIELNVQHPQGVEGALTQLRSEWTSVIDAPPPSVITGAYCEASLSITEVQQLVDADLKEPSGSRALYKVWPDFPIQPLIDRSCATVKVDAARRSYSSSGRGIVWAVLDSGIDANHPHFQRFANLEGGVEGLHRDFTQPGDPQPGGSLTDACAHGTHVAGIIAGMLPSGATPSVFQQVQNTDFPAQSLPEPRAIDDISLLAGMAPEAKLVSLKVLDDSGHGSSMNIIRALEYVRKLNDGQALMRIHGVNLSVGYEFDPTWFACGQSPLCAEVNRLVRSGVVVVVAAGNTGYGPVITSQRPSRIGLTMTINDPGNAELAVTVGATHRDMPHTYGVSYFSSKGPTGDGRSKPDLVAPGERITSCAAGSKLAALGQSSGAPVYVEDSGTSMAAPHVSGIIAGFLSIRAEYIAQPEAIKRIFTTTATSLDREPSFQGSGLIDSMRAIQSV
jgi:serine protease AprX